MARVQITYNPNGSMKWSKQQRDIITKKFHQGRTQSQIADECTAEWRVKITLGMKQLKCKMSAAGRAKIAAAQKARWAKIKAAKKS